MVEQVIRPTGLVDPEIEVHPAQGQVPHLLEGRSRSGSALGERVLVTTLTKRLAEDLSALHPGSRHSRAVSAQRNSDARARRRFCSDLREGDFDVLVGINLLREGLDLPEVSMVAILDADKAGFLRSRNIADPDDRPRRAECEREGDPLCRHDHAGDAEGDGRDRAAADSADEVQRRARHHAADDQEGDPRGHRIGSQSPADGVRKRFTPTKTQFDQTEIVKLLEEEMLQAAKNLEFERAAQLRDKINEMKGAPIIKSGSDWSPEEDERSAEDLAAQDAVAGAETGGEVICWGRHRVPCSARDDYRALMGRMGR